MFLLTARSQQSSHITLSAEESENVFYTNSLSQYIVVMVLRQKLIILYIYSIICWVRYRKWFSGFLLLTLQIQIRYLHDTLKCNNKGALTKYGICDEIPVRNVSYNCYKLDVHRLTKGSSRDLN